MTYPQQHQYVSVIGDAYNGAEAWQFGFRITDGGVSNASTATALGPILQAWWTGGVGYSSGTDFKPPNTHRLLEIKVARIDTNGLYPPAEAAGTYFFPAPLIGALAPSTWMLPQNTVAVTLTTALPRGLASKGRMYLPPSTEAQIAVDGRMSITAATRFASNVQALVNAVNAQALIGNVAIFSRGKAVRGPDKPNGKPTYTYPGVGAVQNVTGVKCGRVIDTQRRRRRSITELPVVLAL